MKSVLLPVAHVDGWASLDAIVLHPIKLSIDEAMVPVSTATMIMPRGESLLTRKMIIELFTIHGSAGRYRVRSIDIDYKSDTVTYQLEHMIAEVGDWCVLQDTSGTYTAKNAITRLWEGTGTNWNYRGQIWALGDMSALSGFSVELDVKNRDNVLTSILDVLDGCPGVYMQFVSNNINFVKMDDSTYSDNIAYGALTRNISSAQVSWDFTDQCTRVRYYYESWRAYTADQDHRDMYGIVESKVNTENESSLARAQYVAQEYLRKNQDPRLSVSMTGQDLYAITGVEQDKLEIGKPFRLLVPELDSTFMRNITKLSWSDVYGDPLGVNVTLGEEDPTLWAYLKSIKKK